VRWVLLGALVLLVLAAPSLPREVVLDKETVELGKPVNVTITWDYLGQAHHDSWDWYIYLRNAGTMRGLASGTVEEELLPVFLAENITHTVTTQVVITEDDLRAAGYAIPTTRPTEVELRVYVHVGSDTVYRATVPVTVVEGETSPDQGEASSDLSVHPTPESITGLVQDVVGRAVHVVLLICSYLRGLRL